MWQESPQPPRAKPGQGSAPTDLCLVFSTSERGPSLPGTRLCVLPLLLGWPWVSEIREPHSAGPQQQPHGLSPEHTCLPGTAKARLADRAGERTWLGEVVLREPRPHLPPLRPNPTHGCQSLGASGRPSQPWHGVMLLPGGLSYWAQEDVLMSAVGWPQGGRDRGGPAMPRSRQGTTPQPRGGPRSPSLGRHRLLQATLSLSSGSSLWGPVWEEPVLSLARAPHGLPRGTHQAARAGGQGENTDLGESRLRCSLGLSFQESPMPRAREVPAACSALAAQRPVRGSRLQPGLPAGGHGLLPGRHAGTSASLFPRRVLDEPLLSPPLPPGPRPDAAAGGPALLAHVAATGPDRGRSQRGDLPEGLVSWRFPRGLPAGGGPSAGPGLALKGKAACRAEQRRRARAGPRGARGAGALLLFPGLWETAGVSREPQARWAEVCTHITVLCSLARPGGRAGGPRSDPASWGRGHVPWPSWASVFGPASLHLLEGVAREGGGGASPSPIAQRAQGAQT